MTDVYIIGAGMTPFTRTSAATLTELARHAACLALQDADLDPRSVGAGYFANVLGPQLTGEVTAGQHVMAELGIRRIPIVNVENACTSGSTAIWLAVNTIRAGAADVVLVVGAEKMSVPGLGLLSSGSEELETLLGLVTPASFALRATRHMHEFGTTERQLAMVSVKNRRHAADNPCAEYRELITIEEVLAAPMIADPITRLQCCPIADGAAAVVIASGEAARKSQRKIRMDAAVLCSGSYENPVDLVRWETDYRGCQLAYDQAGIGPDDLDLVECHDAFSIAEIMHYEALGLCAQGAGGALVESGDTALGGRIPVNVSGGLLSRGHPIAATGCAQVVELVQQLRGEAGPRQVEQARIGLAHCMGGDQAGDAKSCTVIILSK
jgi:acetyl-CoA acetyltransferase